MKKVLVIGSGGSGKSTFSVRLGRLLNIEVIHLSPLMPVQGLNEVFARALPPDVRKGPRPSVKGVS